MAVDLIVLKRVVSDVGSPASDRTCPSLDGMSGRILGCRVTERRLARRPALVASEVVVVRGDSRDA